MFTIRNYKHSDFNMIDSWWKTSKEYGPTPTMLPEDSTFICSIKNIPALCITVYLTNCKDVSYLENFIGNPEVKNRKEASQYLINHAYSFAKDKGYKHTICFAHKEPLVNRYQELGMTKTLVNMTGFGRKL